MKTLACIIGTTMLAGCAHMDLGAMGAAMQGQRDYQAQSQGVYQQPAPPQHLEYMCFSNCTSLNQYSYAFCKAKCTY